MFGFSSEHSIEWKFFLSRTNWWGSFFERFIAIMKIFWPRQVGQAFLHYNELEDKLLNVDSFMNNGALCYVKEEFDQPFLMPSILLRVTPAQYRKITSKTVIRTVISLWLLHGERST